MRSRLLAMAALSLGLLATPFALAQTTGSTSQVDHGKADREAGRGLDVGTREGGEDGPNYMTGPGVRLFYTDETMTTLRPREEMRVVYYGMDPNERIVLTRSCASNEDTRFVDLCSAVGTW
jgi:hypothetical protein